MTDQTETLCPSDGKPCTLKCNRGYPSRQCDPVRKARVFQNDDAPLAVIS